MCVGVGWRLVFCWSTSIPQHRLAIIMFCCQLNVLWPCETLYNCACGKKKEAEGGAPAIEITDAVEEAVTIERE